MAFEHARNTVDVNEIDLAVEIVRMSVTAIVLLAPLGAICITNSGPYLLNKITVEEHKRERELSYLRIIALQPFRPPKKRKKRTRDTVTIPPINST